MKTGGQKHSEHNPHGFNSVYMNKDYVLWSKELKVCTCALQFTSTLDYGLKCSSISWHRNFRASITSKIRSTLSSISVRPSKSSDTVVPNPATKYQHHTLNLLWQPHQQRAVEFLERCVSIHQKYPTEPGRHFLRSRYESYGLGIQISHARSLEWKPRLAIQQGQLVHEYTGWSIFTCLLSGGRWVKM